MDDSEVRLERLDSNTASLELLAIIDGNYRVRVDTVGERAVSVILGDEQMAQLFSAWTNHQNAGDPPEAE